MTTGDRAKMFSSHLSSTPKIENSGISGHFCFGEKCPVCQPNDTFKRMSENLDAQNRLALESGTLPPEEEALIRENLYPEETLHKQAMERVYAEHGKEGESFEDFQKRYVILMKDGIELLHAHSPDIGAWKPSIHELTLRSPRDKKLVIMGPNVGKGISIASMIGQNVMIPEPELDPEPVAIEPEFTPKQKRPPSRLVQALMGRIEPTQHLWYKDYMK